MVFQILNKIRVEWEVLKNSGFKIEFSADFGHKYQINSFQFLKSPIKYNLTKLLYNYSKTFKWNSFGSFFKLLNKYELSSENLKKIHIYYKQVKIYNHECSYECER